MFHSEFKTIMYYLILKLLRQHISSLGENVKLMHINETKHKYFHAIKSGFNLKCLFISMATKTEKRFNLKFLDLLHLICK